MKGRFLLAIFACFVLIENTYALSNEWYVTIAPFLWNIDLNGTAIVGQRHAHADQTKLGGMLILGVQKNRVGVFANTIYSQMSGTTHRTYYDVEVTNKYGILTAAAFYEFLNSLSNNVSLSTEPYLGGRYTVKITYATITAPGFRYRTSQNEDWLDPVIGVRLNFLLNRAWSLFLSGDIGGTNRSTQYSYNTIALLGYQIIRPCFTTGIYAGYQILDQHYITGSGAKYFDWNMKLSGPLAGIEIKF